MKQKIKRCVCERAIVDTQDVDICGFCGNDITYKDILLLFKASFNKKYFFSNYAKTVTNWRQKCIGKNRNGNKIDFTDSDITAIQQGLNQLFKELNNSN